MRRARVTPPSAATPSPGATRAPELKGRFQSVEWDGGLLVVEGLYGFDETGAQEGEPPGLSRDILEVVWSMLMRSLV